MKKLKNLDDFQADGRITEGTTGLNEAGVSDLKRKTSTPDKTKFRFEVSDNLKKIAKIQKTLLDMVQMVTEMNDEIVALKVSHPNMSPEAMKILNNMQYNLSNINGALRREDKKGSKTGMIDNSNRLRRNMEKLKASGAVQSSK